MMLNFRFILALTIILFALSNAGKSQPLSRMSIDFRGGIPSILSRANQNAAPFGGVGIRYSFNPYLSLSVDANSGVLAGRTANGFFRNNFIQYGGKVHFNPLSFIKDRPDVLKRFNLYVSFGMNNMNYYYTLQQTSIENKLSRTFFMYDAGLKIHYYANEMVDFIGGTNFNFTQSPSIDNYRDGKYDHFALTYLGLSVKLLPYERKQTPDWTHIDLPYNTGTMALTKELVGNLEKDMSSQNQKNTDSIAALRKEIKEVEKNVGAVDDKVDSVDAKLDLVLAMLTQMRTQGVNINQGGSNNAAPAQPGAKGAKKGTQAPGKTTTTPTTATTPAILEDPSSWGKIDTVAASTVSSGAQPGSAGKSISKTEIIDQSKVKESYAIVVGSFQKDENALKARERYTAKGWDARILGNAHSSNKRIVIFSNNYFEAAKIVTELRTTENPDVWMLDIATGKGVFIK